MRDGFPSYRPGGPWELVVSVTRVIEEFDGHDRDRKLMAAMFRRLADAFGVMHDQREHDLAKLFAALADISEPLFDFSQDPLGEDDDEDEPSMEHQPLAGE
jgi:hypothetical protein